MVDEDVVYVSTSTTYRILTGENLVCPWRRRTKRSREADETARWPDRVWATDLKYVSINGRNCYLVSFLDEYSRYVVHWELLSGMDGHSVSTAAQAALEKLPRDVAGELARPVGLVTDRDLALAVCSGTIAPNDPVGNLMTCPVETVADDEPASLDQQDRARAEDRYLIT
jgi:hypothetical protein